MTQLLTERILSLKEELGVIREKKSVLAREIKQLEAQVELLDSRGKEIVRDVASINQGVLSGLNTP